MKIINFSKILPLLLIAGTFYCGEQTNPLPESLNGYKRTQFLQGKEAEEFVNRLHLKTVVSKKSEIAFYQKNQEDLKIYITHYASAESAETEKQKMVDKIIQTPGIFIKGKNLTIEDLDVFRCFGMGQTHYIFNIAEKLFWVSCDTMTAADFISYYLDYLD